MPTVRCLLATALLALGLSATASAKTVTYKNIELRSNGLTCRNLDGHGFHLERGHIRRF